jgi:hypothetical protein
MPRLSTPPPQQDILFIYRPRGFAMRFDKDGTPFRRASPDTIANMLHDGRIDFDSETTLFWHAQLAHYGFSSTSHTRDAKLRLENAIRRGSLHVPQAISDIEIRLKQRWSGENSTCPRYLGSKYNM